LRTEEIRGHPLGLCIDQNHAGAGRRRGGCLRSRNCLCLLLACDLQFPVRPLWRGRFLLAFSVPTAPADHGKPASRKKKIRNALRFFSCAPEGRAPSSARVSAARDPLAGRDTNYLKTLARVAPNEKCLPRIGSCSTSPFRGPSGEGEEYPRSIIQMRPPKDSHIRLVGLWREPR
jgi:hypothetical protein